MIDRDDYFDDDDFDEDDDFDRWNPPVTTSDAKLRIMSARCSTCIFHAGNRMHLNPGRVRDMTAQTDATDSNVTCHKTLGTPLGALCAGSVDRRPGQLVRIMGRLGGIVYVDEAEYAEAAVE